MAPLVKPYLPEGKVSSAIISGEIDHTLYESLKLKNINILMTNPLDSLPLPLASHADMQLVNVTKGLFVIAPGVSCEILDYLEYLGCEVIVGDTQPGGEYPSDIAYNCAIIGDYAFLNTSFTDKNLINILVKCGKRLIDVKQGYAKCSTCILSDKAIITADKWIHKKAREEAGIDSLLIPPQRNIRIKGYGYGFIGGASGLISQNELAFFGSFDSLDSADIIYKFLDKHGIHPVSLTQENPVDIGGLIPLCSE